MATLLARLLRVRPDPLDLARRLQAAGHDDVALLHDARPGGGASWLAAGADAESAALDPKSDAPRSGPHAGTPEWIGAIPYEARRGLERPAWGPPDARADVPLSRPCWRRYPAVCRIDRASGDVMAIARDTRALEAMCRALETPPAPAGPARFEVGCDEPPADHLARVGRARRLIIDGDLYQVNVARRLDVVLVAASALDGYARLVSRAPNRFCALLPLDGHHVLSTSPELLLSYDGRRVLTEPIKGTRPRGHDAAGDAALAAALDADPKERAELAMIVDVERNDLGSVCLPGSVRILEPPRVVTSTTVHHRSALLGGLLQEGVSRAEVLAAMVPSGSVTGAPKIRAMEVIAELERHRRGLYTGGFGYVAHDGSVALGMAIRSVVLAADLRGHYWTGGGIVADSDPARELEETEWKARQLV